jgi:hypothetical protein
MQSERSPTIGTAPPTRYFDFRQIFATVIYAMDATPSITSQDLSDPHGAQSQHSQVDEVLSLTHYLATRYLTQRAQDGVCQDGGPRTCCPGTAGERVATRRRGHLPGVPGTPPPGPTSTKIGAPSPSPTVGSARDQLAHHLEPILYCHLPWIQPLLTRIRIRRLHHSAGTPHPDSVGLKWLHLLELLCAEELVPRYYSRI